MKIFYSKFFYSVVKGIWEYFYSVVNIQFIWFPAAQATVAEATVYSFTSLASLAVAIMSIRNNEDWNSSRRPLYFLKYFKIENLSDQFTDTCSLSFVWIIHCKIFVCCSCSRKFLREKLFKVVSYQNIC